MLWAGNTRNVTVGILVLAIGRTSMASLPAPATLPAGKCPDESIRIIFFKFYCTIPLRQHDEWEILGNKKISGESVIKPSNETKILLAFQRKESESLAKGMYVLDEPH
jgi:hypothetical protein